MTNANSDSTHKLQQHIQKLEKTISKQNSFRHRFLIGIVSGIGTAIGATIIAGIIIALLANLIHSVDDIPILNKIIFTGQVENFLRYSQSN